MAQPSTNQLVSFTDAQSLGLYLQSGQSNVTSNLIMTRSDATTKYILNLTALSAYPNNQCPPKSAILSNCENYTMSAPTVLLDAVAGPGLSDYSEINYYNCTNVNTVLRVYYGNANALFTLLSFISFFTSTNGTYGPA